MPFASSIKYRNSLPFNICQVCCPVKYRQSYPFPVSRKKNLMWMPVFLPPPTSTEMHADVRHPVSCIDSSSFITVSIPFVRPEQCTCRFTYMVKNRFSNVDRFYVILSGERLLVIIINRVNHYATKCQLKFIWHLHLLEIYMDSFAT